MLCVELSPAVLPLTRVSVPVKFATLKLTDMLMPLGANPLRSRGFPATSFREFSAVST